VPAAQFRTLHGFDGTFLGAAGEDRDFCDRWRNVGFKLTYVPEAVVYHAHHMGGRGYWRQHFNYGRAAWHFHQRRAQREQQPLRLEPLAFYTNLVCSPWQQVDVQRKPLLSALLVVSQLGNSSGFFYEAARHQLRGWRRGKIGTHDRDLGHSVERLDP
jgi:GT2 family glycosyltransferase